MRGTHRILVVGASGMLGHEAPRVLARDFEVWGACRHPEALPDLGVPRERLIGGLDATDADSAYAEHLGWEVEITPVDEPVTDRSLDSTRFRGRTGWEPPSWDEMLETLAAEYTEHE